MNNNYLLEMRKISKEFPGVLALNNVDFKIKTGEVHALVGENGAGKSTLMKILAGIYQPDSGEILWNGNEVKIRDSKTALSLGISMIHQELNPVPQMTIAENIFLGREPASKVKGFINFKKMYSDTKKILQDQDLVYNPRTKVANLSISDTQLIEIVKAITYESSLIIMDEPTSALTELEIENLYKRVRELKKRGVSIIFITHKLDEIFKIVDTVTILRDGKFIDSKPIENLTKDEIISMMVGREITNLYPKMDIDIGEKVFEADGLTRNGVFNNISFKVNKGEILGIYGLMGSGRTEVVRAIFGLDPLDKGKITINSKTVKVLTPQDSIKSGIAMVTEDRKNFGVILCRSVLENISLPNLRAFSRFMFLNKRLERKKIADISKIFNIKTPNLETMVNSLSGGNQQKVVVAKWYLLNPRVLILDEPTRGIDVGAKYEIHKIMNDLAGKGMAIIMISSEMPEVLGMSDRIIVMHKGEITGELKRKEATQEKIMILGTGGKIDSKN